MVPEPKMKDLPTNRTKAEVFAVLREKIISNILIDLFCEIYREHSPKATVC